ncbi:carbohydrate kinase family protein [Ornithinimicrobium ciconiae]|uniref:Carbohydrate kinase family protein n=1 Tax=Ornithinimicrobium ciconiae TaxID=2594265 RepID=A0A516GA45_9MICO|nr:carbohydrate kinase family protein [Ornithinimicrobium ciconiae]QDO88388.1 carbohydrate kinase family protein [Ornithinimicrobium ciconiae]
MKIAVCGSIATDHLMTYQGRFADSLVADQLAKISVSFLVEDLQVRRGGIGANISFGMARLGHHPVLVGAVGEDFASYRSWLERHGVNCEHIHVSEMRHTARFVCTTDEDMAQIASFYAGAMSEARQIELGPIVTSVGGIDLVMVSPDDPEAMLRHSDECRTRGIAFAADPSQQLAVMDGASIRQLIDGATYLFTNEYEAAMTEQKTGWSAQEILERVGTRVITRGKDGASVLRLGQEPIEVPIATDVHRVDPTGVGDAFRAGFLAGLAWELPLRRCAELGSTLAGYVLETVGTQEYTFDTAHFLDRFTQAYGDQAGAEVAARMA